MSTDPLHLQNPIVLIHGLGSRSTYGPVDYFFGLPKLLRENRNNVFIPNLTSWQTIKHRAEELKIQIEKKFPEGKVNLVGHSMGGLDARYLASQLGFADRISSITTIGTPNQGTSIGDIATGFLPPLAFNAINKFLNLMGLSGDAVKQITCSYYKTELSQLIPNMPGVEYFSATSTIQKPIVLYSLPLFWVSYKLLEDVEGPNDGFVSVSSATWGHHICTYLGDHYAQMGQFLGRARGMDYMQFYADIFKCLKKKGM
jgi:triacylglycerol lipase